MFVQVVPVVRTPAGVDVFDYRLPAGFEARVGDLIRVPFRKQITPALVVALLKTSPVAHKALDAIDSYAGLSFPSSLVELLHWTAARTFTSKPTVLAAWMRQLPKRPTSIAFEAPKPRLTSGSLIAHWNMSASAALVERARVALKENQRVLLITPWKNRVLRYQQQLPGAQGLHSDMADGQAFQAWQAFVTGQTRCLITTRLGAWLSPVSDVVLIDEPENDDHKQDDLAPRYDARLMSAWCSRFAGTQVEGFGLTPPLHTRTIAPTITTPLHVIIRERQGRSSIPMVQADTLLLLKDHDGPRVIIHPIRGVAASLVCRDCGWRAICANCGFGLRAEKTNAVCRQCGKMADLPQDCGSCGGVDLGKAMPGIEQLKQAWQRHEQAERVEWRDQSNESIDPPFPTGALVVITDGSLLGGGFEDVRRTERQCQTFRRLANRVAECHGTLIIQSDEALASSWHSWLTAEGVTAWQERERHDRELFQYPPAKRLVKILVDGTEQEAIHWMEKAKPTIDPNAQWRGPFHIPFRAKSRRERHVLHLIFLTDTTEQQLITQLTPLARSAIIDLDPIAFFH